MQTPHLGIVAALVSRLTSQIWAVSDDDQVTKVIDSIVRQSIVSGYETAGTAARAQTNAFQGLLALEFMLFGRGSDSLVTAGGKHPRNGPTTASQRDGFYSDNHLARTS